MAQDLSLLGEFVTEAFDHLEKAEGALLDLETNPDSAESVNLVFRAFHTIKGTSGFLSLDDINKLAHKAETLLDRARKGEIKLTGSYADVTLDAVDMLKRLAQNVRARIEGKPAERPDGYVELLERLGAPDAEVETGREAPRLGDVLVAQGSIERSVLEKVASEPGGKIGEKLMKAQAVSAKDVARALRTQQQMSGQAAATVDSSLRVSMTRLDKLIDMVGELVIANAIVVQDDVVRAAGNHNLTKKVGQLGKITRELHDLTLSMRMVPLKSTFQKMERLVRDLAKKSGKDVRFVGVGEDTEIDRNMVEGINDPLVHMMRNCVDHGIESPEAREAAGKPRQGTVTLRACHAAGSVVIEVSDDGKGIDAAKVRAKAVERKLIDPNKELSPAEVYELIFLPGFSTADKVTDVSGRGVGMDVVKKNIEAMRGRVDIQSEAGNGSRFTIRMPLTLAIIDGMLLKVGAENYILPTLAIKHAIQPDAKSLSTVVGRGEMVTLRGQIIPVFRLYRLFGVQGAKEDPSQGLLIVVEHEGLKVALLADALLGQQQVVIKSVGTALGQVDGVSGASIMGDGRVGLILDVAGIMRIAHGHDKEKRAA
jgi:two-component system chemotaxis sensor kinase CheA